MCNDGREICQLCRQDITNEECSAASDHEPSCGENGLDHSLSIEQSRPDICPDCTSDGYRELHKTFEVLAMPVRESIATLQGALAENQRSLDKVSRRYQRRVNESRTAIENPDADWSMKHDAFAVVDTTPKHTQRLMEYYSRAAIRLAEDLGREKKRLLTIQRHHLAELDLFRQEHSLSVLLHPAHASSPTPQP